MWPCWHKANWTSSSSGVVGTIKQLSQSFWGSWSGSSSSWMAMMICRGPCAERLKRLRSSLMEYVLHPWMRRTVLPRSSLLITTQTLASWNPEPLLRQPHSDHILRGFSEDKKRSYLRSYFTDEKQVRNALDIVQANDVLYKACQVLGICWLSALGWRADRERQRGLRSAQHSAQSVLWCNVINCSLNK